MLPKRASAQQKKMVEC